LKQARVRLAALDVEQVELTEDAAAPSLLDQSRERENAARDAILADPAVVAAMQAFPDAELLDFDREDKRSLIA